MKRLLLASTLLCPVAAWGQPTPPVTQPCNNSSCLYSSAAPLVGDGNGPAGTGTDNTAALQTWINSLPSSGGTPFLQPSTSGSRYAISNEVTLSSNTTLVCSAGVEIDALAGSTFTNGAMISNANYGASSITDHDLTVNGCTFNAASLQSAPVTVLSASRPGTTEATSSLVTYTVSALPTNMAANLAAGLQTTANLAGITGDTTLDGVFPVVSASGTTVVVVSPGPFPSTGGVAGTPTMATNKTGGLHAISFRMAQHVYTSNNRFISVGDGVSEQSTDDTHNESNWGTNITNALSDHFGGATNIHVDKDDCELCVWYGVFDTGSAVGGTLSLYAQYGEITNSVYKVLGAPGAAGIEFNGIGTISGIEYTGATMSITGTVATVTAVSGGLGTITLPSTVGPIFGAIPGTQLLTAGTGTGLTGTYFTDAAHAQTLPSQKVILNGNGVLNVSVTGNNVVFLGQNTPQICWRGTGATRYNSFSHNKCNGGSALLGGDFGGNPADNDFSDNSYENTIAGTVFNLDATTANNKFAHESVVLGNSTANESVLDNGSGNIFTNVKYANGIPIILGSGTSIVSFPQVSGVNKVSATGCSNSGVTSASLTSAKVALGANSCSLTLTMGGGSYAKNGWACSPEDLTSPTVFIGQSSSTTTTAIISVPVTAGATDVLSIGCLPL